MDDLLPDLGQLRTFLAIVDENGFGRAATSLGITQPSVSQQMRRLEQRLGHRLFAPDGRQSKLTPDGEALLIFARSMLSVAHKLRHYFSQPRSGGVVRIGFTEDFARTSLPSVLNLFLRSFPDVAIEIEANNSSRELFGAIEQRRLDLVVAKSLVERDDAEFLWRDHQVWLTRADHEVRTTDPIPLVLPAAPSETRDVALHALGEAGRSWKIQFQSTSLGALRAAVGAGIGISVGVRSLIAPEFAPVPSSAGLPALPDVYFHIARVPEPHHPGIDALVSILREVVLHIGGRADAPMTQAVIP